MSPLTNPVINITAGISWPTTITAKKPRKIHTKIPLPSLTAPDAANAVTGAMVLDGYYFVPLNLSIRIRKIQKVKKE